MSIQLTFEGCVQDAQEYGSNDVWMVSRVFFWIRQEGGPSGDFPADLKRVAGDKFDRMRVLAPVGYTGPMAYADLRQRVGQDFDRNAPAVAEPVGCPIRVDQTEFEKHAVAYFRSLATESGVMMRIDEGRPLRGGTRPTAHIRMSHNAWAKRWTVELEARSG